MGLFGGKSETEWGYRFKNRDVWVGSKSEAESAIKRMKKAVKAGGTPPKLIQRTKKLTAIKKRAKNSCSGGKCDKRGSVCKKHFQGMTRGTTARGGQYTASEWSLESIHARWDEEGHRWS